MTYFSKENRYALRVLEITQAVWGHLTGSNAGNMLAPEYDEAIRFLRYRLTTWDSSYEGNKKYEDSVKTMIEETLQRHQEI